VVSRNSVLNKTVKILLVVSAVACMLPAVSATEIDSGYIQATSTGTITEDIGFRPDYIEFITAQQIESTNFEESVSTNSNCPQNVNGWSEGSVVFDSNGVDKQFAIGMFRNSDSTNDHRVASSTSHVIKNVYSGRNGGKCGELRVSVTQPLDNGFEVNVEDKYASYDEIIRYKAYQFPDNMKFDVGMVKIDSEGSRSIETGFQPANLHIRAGQQISGKNIDTQFGDNDPDTDNTLGRSKGYATLDEDGNVIDQQSIGTASSSDSTNAHRSIASDQYILNSAYVGQDGNLLDSSEPSRLRAKVTGADNNGFNLQVDDKWSGTDEVFLYRAWGFSYYDFKIGYHTYPSTYTNWDADEPNDSGGNESCGEMLPGGEWNDIPCDYNHPGLCEYGSSSYNTTSNTEWSIAKDTCESWGGNLAIIDNSSENSHIADNFGNVWIGYNQSSGASEPGGGWGWINRLSFKTGFEPDAIDIYSEQQIGAINQEVVTPTNSGCSNAGGWSNGFYEADDYLQWSLSMGRTSDSQNSHRQASSTLQALNNVYSGQDGGDCGNFEGEVTDVSNSGFSMDFSYDSNFENNYGKEMVYFRAFNFRLVPPQITSIEFNNSTSEHAFSVVANVSEGSNDVESCEITAESDAGNSKIYSGTVNKINETHSQCLYDRIMYDGVFEWEERHDQDGELLNLDITVKAEDIDGLSSERTESNTFPNNDPSIEGISSINYSTEHAFNISSEIKLPDDKESELGRCEIILRFEGNTKDVSSDSKLEHEGGDKANCRYSKVDETTFNDAEPGDQIEVEMDVFDHHGGKGNITSSFTIPNRVPVIESNSPKEGDYTSESPITVSVQASDQDDEEFYIYLFNHTDNYFLTKKKVTDFEQLTYDWDLPEAYSEYELRITVGDEWENYTKTVNFQKIIGGEYRSDIDINREYTSIVTSTNEIQDFYITVSNRIRDDKRVNVTLSDVNAEFGNGKSYKEVNLNGYDSEEVLVRVMPEKTGDRTLTVTSKNMDVGLNKTREIPVYVREPNTASTPAEVPGVGSIQILFVALMASTLYYLRL